MRREEDMLLGLVRNPLNQCGRPVLDAMSSTALTIREHSTLHGMLREWPYFDRRGHGKWNGVERRAGKLLPR